MTKYRTTEKFFFHNKVRNKFDLILRCTVHKVKLTQATENIVTRIRFKRRLLNQNFKEERLHLFNYMKLKMSSENCEERTKLFNKNRNICIL